MRRTERTGEQENGRTGIEEEREELRERENEGA